MKYPQLVSSRTIREISDWLIKRLEELEIESVYSRLLLSLLHTPFKVNAVDLLEIPQLKDLKQPYHLLNKNNEELKRLAAVEILMDVSAEDNKSNIISLVDELRVKLRKVESTCEDNSGRASNVALSPSSNSKFYKNLKKIKRSHENPTKNYYLAFPALTGSKKTTKASTTVTSEEGVKKSSLSEVVAATKKDSNLKLLCWSSLMSKENSNMATTTVKDAAADEFSGGDGESARGGVVALKRPRRKRRYGRHTDRAITKTDVQSKAKSYDVYDGATLSPKVKNSSKKHQRNQLVTKNPKTSVTARNNPPSMWDMDFKGHWEMDRDLISEFYQQQQKTHHPAEVKSANQAKEQTMDDEDDQMLMKFLPKKLMDDDDDDDENIEEMAKKESQSISSLKSKFDENVKALWNDEEPPSSLVSSFTSEKNSLGLFNFNGHQPHQEVVAPCTNLMYRSSDFMSLSEFDCNNGGVAAAAASYHHPSSSAMSPSAVEKFIKSGTNLQASIWSSDGGDYTCKPESLIYKDVVDDAIYKRSIGTEMKTWKKSGEDEASGSDVSLFNHSDVSAFKKFRPLMTSTIIRANYHPSRNMPQTILDSENDDENLLTSKRTHFTPVTIDGHSFIIDNSWDEVKWERSASGGLIYNNQRYMTWKGKPAYNNYDADTKIDLDAMEEEARSDFTIKFLVKDENDKACQTDLADFLRATNRSLLEINEEYCKRKIYDEYCRIGDNNNKWRYSDDNTNDYSFFTVNRIKHSLPPPPALISSNSSSSSICTITSSSAVDPFESWRTMKLDMEPDCKQACMHSLWEQCATCTRNNDPDVTTIPANRLLKDELRMDGEEIMSVIQNLYITGDYCEEEEKEEDDDIEDINHHFYLDLLDDSMDSKFYGEDGGCMTKTLKEEKKLTPNMFEQLQLENFDEITMAKMQWQWDKNLAAEKDQEKYVKLLKWIQSSLVHPDNNNNELSTVQRPKNRKRRHSTTCQMKKMSQDFVYAQSPSSGLIEDNFFVDAAKMKMLKVLLIEKEENDGANNYYRNILQQQHALIKQMDLARPLTR